MYQYLLAKIQYFLTMILPEKIICPHKFMRSLVIVTVPLYSHISFYSISLCVYEANVHVVLDSSLCSQYLNLLVHFPFYLQFLFSEDNESC